MKNEVRRFIDFENINIEDFKKGYLKLLDQQDVLLDELSSESDCMEAIPHIDIGFDASGRFIGRLRIERHGQSYDDLDGEIHPIGCRCGKCPDTHVEECRCDNCKSERDYLQKRHIPKHEDLSRINELIQGFHIHHIDMLEKLLANLEGREPHGINGMH